MWLLVVAVDFTIGRPQTTAGWIGLAFITLVVLWILIRGSESILEKTAKSFLTPALGLVVFLGVLVVLSTLYSDDPNDPLIQGEVEVSPNQSPAGKTAEVHPDLDDHVGGE